MANTRSVATPPLARIKSIAFSADFFSGNFDLTNSLSRESATQDKIPDKLEILLIAIF